LIMQSTFHVIDLSINSTNKVFSYLIKKRKEKRNKVSCHTKERIMGNYIFPLSTTSHCQHAP
jgi:hypothetical protein